MGEELVWACKNGDLDQVKAIVDKEPSDERNEDASIESVNGMPGGQDRRSGDDKTPPTAALLPQSSVLPKTEDSDSEEESLFTNTEDLGSDKPGLFNTQPTTVTPPQSSVLPKTEDSDSDSNELSIFTDTEILASDEPGLFTGSHCKCNKNCFTTVGVQECQRVLERFNSIGKNEQNVHLQIWIEKAVPKRLGAGGCNGLYKPGKEKRCSYRYYVQKTDQTKAQVCKAAFKSIHNVTERRLKTVREKTDPTDMRGRHTNRPNKIEDNLKNQVRAHIKSFPARLSYSSSKETLIKGKSCLERHLSSELSVKKMYLKYLEKYERKEVFQEKLRCKQENSFMPPKPKISLNSYRKVFKTEFNLKFGLP